MEIVKKGQKAEKKPTNAQLQRRIQNAVVFVEKDKDTKSIFFDDKGLRLTITIDYAIIETGAHRHVFDFITPFGNVSRPYIYTKRFVEIAEENDCVVEDKSGNKSRSYAKLFSTLKEKDDKSDYNMCWYIDKWFYNLFQPLYEIDETTAGTFLVYERYAHNVARQTFLLSEHKEDVTNMQFVNAIIENEKSFLDGIDESVILEAKTDEQRMKDEMDAIQKNADENVMEEQVNGEQK